MRKIYSKKEISDLTLGSANIFLAFEIILFLIYLFVPLFGGEFSFLALLVYGSCIGLALLFKFWAKKIRSEQDIRGCPFL